MRLRLVRVIASEVHRGVAREWRDLNWPRRDSRSARTALRDGNAMQIVSPIGMADEVPRTRVYASLPEVDGAMVVCDS